MQPVERIFELVDLQFKEQQEFAAAVGVSKDTASNWRRGVSHSYNKHLGKIAEVLGTTTEYLLTGSRPEPVGGDLSAEDETILRQLHDSPDLRVMFSLTSKASPEDIKRALQTIRLVLNQPEETP